MRDWLMLLLPLPIEVVLLVLLPRSQHYQPWVRWVVSLGCAIAATVWFFGFWRQNWYLLPYVQRVAALHSLAFVSFFWFYGPGNCQVDRLIDDIWSVDDDR